MARVRHKARRVTLTAIARHLGLSHATVSTVLTGRHNGIFVSPATSQRIRAVAARMGYRLHHLRARTPRLTRVALFVPPFGIFQQALLEICDVLNRERIQTLVHTHRSGSDNGRLADDLFRRRQVEAAVFIGSVNSRDRLPATALPHVILGDVPAGVRVWRVGVDNTAGGRTVGRHLLDLGHRHVGMILTSSIFCEHRLHGLRRAWIEHGLEADRVRELRIETVEGLAGRVAGFLEAARRQGRALTALFCFNDYLALDVLRVLRQAGLRVPEDLSLVGFDDADFARSLDPPLTTVQHQFGQLGTLAAQLLLERLAEPEAEPKTLLVPGRLMVRQSTGPAR